MKTANFKLALITCSLTNFINKNLEVKAFQVESGILLSFYFNYKLLLTPLFSSFHLIFHTTDRNGCVSYCLTYASCKSANFRISTGECSLFGVNSWENEFNIVSDIGNVVIQKYGEPFVSHGQWKLVFRGLANINKPVYEAYTNTSLYHDQPLSPMYPIGCLRLDMNMPCDHHFRSNLLNKWSQLAIHEVKFVIAKDGIIAKSIVFNGTSSTFQSWFSSANVLSSSWSDLMTSTVDFFSIEGFKIFDITRRFYIEYQHPRCDIDSGWFACIDQALDRCPWGMVVPKFPKFLFSPQSTRVANVNMRAADVIAIFIKF